CGILEKRMVKVRLIRFVKAVTLHVSDNSNNRHPRRLRCWTTSFYSQSYRISIGEVAFCKCFVNQDNLRRFAIVCVREEPAAFQRRLDRSKVIRRDHGNLRGRDIVVRYSITFDRKAGGIMLANEGNSITAANRGVAHARNRTHSLQQFLCKRG